MQILPRFVGLLGILDVAASQNLIEIPSVIQNLQETTFRASPTLLKDLLRRHQKQKNEFNC